MKYVIVAMLMAGVCMGQTVVDLPSSFNLFRSNEKLACVATHTSVCYGPTAETIATCLTVPGDSALGRSVLNVSDIVPDPSGRFVYVTMEQEGGLYRLDVHSGGWKLITPSNAGSDVSALHVESSGAVVIGTGGSSWSSKSHARGMFRSTDHGDSWAEVNIREPNLSHYRGVTAIESTANGQLVAGFLSGDGYHPPGMYIQQDTGSWEHLTAMDATKEMVVLRGHLYSTNGNGELYYLDINANPQKGRRILYSRLLNSIHRWHADTLAIFMDSEEDSLPPSVYLVVEGAVVDTIVLMARPVTLEEMKFATDLRNGAPSRFIAFGCGRNSIVDVHGSDVGEVAPTTSLPFVLGVREASSWSSICVVNHGRYVIDTSGIATLDSTIGHGLRGRFLWLNADGEGLMVVRSHELVRMQRAVRDTVVRVRYDTAFNSAVRTDKGTIVFSTHRQCLQEFTIQSSSWKPFSTDGLPHAVCGDSKRDTRIYHVFAVGSALYAWVGGAGNLLDSLKGLYVFRSSWNKVDVQLPIEASLHDCDSYGDVAVLTFRSYVDGQPGGSVVLRIDGAYNAPVLFVPRAPQSPSIFNAVIFGENVAWMAYHGSVWTSPDPSANPIMVRSGANEEIGRVGNKLLVATRDSGVLLYDAP